jgi:hypothetical protein
MDETYYLIKYANFSYGDIKNMPTYERRYYVDKLSKELEKK